MFLVFTMLTIETVGTNARSIIFRSSLTFPAILTDAFIADHILASLTSISNQTCASEILVRVVNTSSAISAGLMVGAIMLVYIAVSTTPTALTDALPRLVTISVHTTGVRNTLIA